MSSTDVQEHFDENGFVGPIDVVTVEESQAAWKQVEEELAMEDSSRFKLHLILPAVSKIAHHPALVKAVQEALGSSNIWLWSSDINIKQPNSPGFFAPHQDATYAGLSPSSKTLTAWIALSDPVGEPEGCLSFYPGSHKCGQLHHETRKLQTSDNNLLSLGQFIPDNILMEKLETTTPVTIPLRAGQATFHSFDCVHESGPNNSSNPRVGLALRYMTASVVQTKPIQEMATWISGKKEGPCFEMEPQLPVKCTKKDIQRGREAQQEAMRREEANYFAGKR